MRAIPNMTVIVPADAMETRGAIAAAASHKGPFYIRLGRNKVPDVFGEGHGFVLGKGCELSPGTAMTFITTGIMTSQALRAAAMLGKEGVSARVVHIGTIKPLDIDIILKAARETGAIVTAEEHSIIGGLGSAIAEVIAERQPVPLKRVGINDRFGTSGKAEELIKYFGLTPENLVEAAREVLERKNHQRL
jgi:transketolase